MATKSEQVYGKYAELRCTTRQTSPPAGRLARWFRQSAARRWPRVGYETAFECNYPDELPVPHLYPTEAGGVHAEWSLDPNEITLDVNLGTRLGEWHVLNMTSDDATERKLNFNDAADWQWLVDRIKGMTPREV